MNKINLMHWVKLEAACTVSEWESYRCSGSTSANHCIKRRKWKTEENDVFVGFVHSYSKNKISKPPGMYNFIVQDKTASIVQRHFTLS